MIDLSSQGPMFQWHFVVPLALVQAHKHRNAVAPREAVWGRSMPSASLLHWQNDRMLRLQQIELQCALAMAPPNAHLIDENLRGYVMLLSAHFQGYCRDLCTEAAYVIASKVRPALRVLIQVQFTAHRRLDHVEARFHGGSDEWAAPERPVGVEQVAQRGRPSRNDGPGGRPARPAFAPGMAEFVRRFGNFAQ